MSKVVSNEAWLEARRVLLEQERALTHARDALAEARRALPRRRVEKRYVFDSRAGERALEELFEGKSQLLIYHFMFAPEWEAGCKSCTFWADGFERAQPHLKARDVTLALVSRAPVDKLAAFAGRIGLTIPWYSSGRSDFNYDFGVSFDPARTARGESTYNYAPLKTDDTDLPGVSAFLRDEDGSVLHTYSTYARGIDALNPAYQLLDLVAKGRDEQGLDFSMSWVRHRDRYGE